MEALVRGFSHPGAVGGLGLGVGLAGFRFPRAAGEYVLSGVALWGAVGRSWPGGLASLLAGCSVLGEYHKCCDDKCEIGSVRAILLMGVAYIF